MTATAKVLVAAAAHNEEKDEGAPRMCLNMHLIARAIST